jgi:hypothetical protein
LFIFLARNFAGKVVVNYHKKIGNLIFQNNEFFIQRLKKVDWWPISHTSPLIIPQTLGLYSSLSVRRVLMNVASSHIIKVRLFNREFEDKRKVSKSDILSQSTFKDAECDGGSFLDDFFMVDY